MPLPAMPQTRCPIHPLTEQSQGGLPVRSHYCHAEKVDFCWQQRHVRIATSTLCSPVTKWLINEKSLPSCREN